MFSVLNLVQSNIQTCNSSHSTQFFTMIPERRALLSSALSWHAICNFPLLLLAKVMQAAPLRNLCSYGLLFLPLVQHAREHFK